MHIDPHVHCRDEEWSYKETIKHSLEVARDSGVDAVFDMPNVQRPIFNLERAIDRIKIAKDANVPEVFYGTFIGLTSDREQVKQAVSTYRELFPYVVGFKLYAGHSTGNLGVIRLEDQEIVYQTLSNEEYEGILFVHAEKESEMNDNIGRKFNPIHPISHCIARPFKAEVESIRDQITLAKKYNFKGKLHIAHISHPDSVDLVYTAKSEDLDISCGVCPHHLIFDWNRMEKDDGILYKMNPPLREIGAPNKMIQHLKEEKINWIETDHAPHTIREKTSAGPASGIPGLPWWFLCEEYLRSQNFSDNLIEKITFSNVLNRFGIDVKKKNPPLKDRSRDYPFNPYQGLEKSLLGV